MIGGSGEGSQNKTAGGLAATGGLHLDGEGKGTQGATGGRITVSMTWMIPLVALRSASITLALLI